MREKIRTPDLLIRSQTLYPAELRAHIIFVCLSYLCTSATKLIIAQRFLSVNNFFHFFVHFRNHLRYAPDDVKNGQQYVGSAYGNRGLLERWECYVDTFHGNNKLMREVICDHPDRYQFFQFSILQIFSMSTPDDIIINAENLWKRKLGTKEYGMNAN